MNLIEFLEYKNVWNFDEYVSQIKYPLILKGKQLLITVHSVIVPTYGKSLIFYSWNNELRSKNEWLTVEEFLQLYGNYEVIEK